MSAASERALIILFLHLEQMEKAGVPIRQSLDTARAETADKKLGRALDVIIYEVKQGRKLHEAMEHYPKIFDVTILGLVELGEKSGKLARVFGQCRTYVKRRDEHARLMRKATREPKITSAVILALAIFRRHTAVPSVVAGAVAFFAAFFMLRNASLSFRYMTDRLFLGIPRLGRFVSEDSWARFAESLAMMYEAGVDLRTGIRVAAKGVPNMVIRESIEDTVPRIEAGASVHAAFTENPRMDKMALALLKAGEDTGNISQTMRELGEYYEKQTEDALTALRQITGPLLTIIAGGMLYLGLY